MIRRSENDRSIKWKIGRILLAQFKRGHHCQRVVDIMALKPAHRSLTNSTVTVEDNLHENSFSLESLSTVPASVLHSINHPVTDSLPKQIWPLLP